MEKIIDVRDIIYSYLDLILTPLRFTSKNISTKNTSASAVINSSGRIPPTEIFILKFNLTNRNVSI